MTALAWLMHNPKGEVVGVVIADNEQDAEASDFGEDVDYMTGPYPAHVTHEWMSGV